MASKTLFDGKPVIDMAELGVCLSRRREELGSSGEMPRNLGAHRTASKKALLDALTKIGAEW